MLVATIREYPWSAPKMWAVVCDKWPDDSSVARSQLCVMYEGREVAELHARSPNMNGWPCGNPRVVEVVHGSENRLFIDAATVSICTVRELFTSDVYAKETLTAVYDECERSYLRVMQATGMVESAAP